jgi:mannose-1-phosphate guanylyltransferase
MTKYGCAVLPAMVLAAGLGTRLRPLTEVYPKPLVPVGDRSVLAHAVDRLRRAGATRLVVNAHYLPERVASAARALEVGVSLEQELLGTAGGVAQARALLGEGPVLLWNGDIVADVDPAGLVESHEASGAEATLVVMPRARDEGNVGIDAEGRVVRLRREAVGPEARSADFACVHVLGDALRRGLPARGCLVADVYIPALRRGATLRVVEHRGPWHDIGSVASYVDANVAWLRARRADRWVAPGAAVGTGVVLEESLVHAGATVEGWGALSRCVVWGGAVAVAPLGDAVVLPGGIVARA